MLRSILVLLSLVLFNSPVLAKAGVESRITETRVALVIGAGHYQSAAALANPVSDARLVATALRHSGFDVTEVVDPDAAAFKAALERFRAKADAADVAMVYYAGHGIEVQGVNWLLPVSINGRTASDLPSEAIRASAIADSVSKAKKIRLVVVDACRDNPYSATAVTASGAAAPHNVVMLFAAQPGTTVTDGRGTATSPFATAFARLVREPGLRLASLPARLSREIETHLGRPQRPDQQGIFDEPDWMFAPLTVVAQAEPAAAFTAVQAPDTLEIMRQFIIPGQATPPKAPPPMAKKPKVVAPPPAPAAPVQVDLERETWNLCAKSKGVSPCQAYLDQYPKGRFAKLAATRIQDMTSPPVAAAPRPIVAPAAPAVEDKEKTDWLLCQNSTAAGACERYLETYPIGRWSTQAKTRIANAKAAEQDKVAAEKARAAAAQQAAQQQAAAAQEKTDWDACQTGAGPAACEKFIATYPGSVRAAAARDRVAKFRTESEESAAWGLCQASSAPGACEKYLSAYPAGAHAAAARDMASRFRSEGEEKSAWALCQNAENALPCERYLSIYRAGPNAAAATALVGKFAKAEQDRVKVEQEKTAWSQCETGKTALPCNDYLRVFPDGRYADSARTRIRVLETAATEPEMVPALGLVVRRNDKGEMVIVSVQQFSSAMGNVFGGDVIVKINDQATKPSDLPRQTIEAALNAASGRVKLLIRRGPAAVTAVIRARP